MFQTIKHLGIEKAKVSFFSLLNEVSQGVEQHPVHLNSPYTQNRKGLSKVP